MSVNRHCWLYLWIAAIALAGPPAFAGPIELTGDLRTDLHTITDGVSPRIRIAPRLLPAMAQADLDRYMNWCDLSLQQREFATAMYAAYADEFVAAVRDNLAAMVEHSQATEQAMTEHTVFSPEFAEIYTKYIRQVDHVNDRTERAAQTCLARIEAILHHDQKPRFERVRLDRARRCVNRTDRMHYASCADLIRIAESIELDAAAMEAIEEVRKAYELKITPLVARNEQSLSNRQVSLTEAWGRLNVDDAGKPLDWSSPGSAAIHQRNRSRVHDILHESAVLQESIHRTNKEFLPRFLEALPAGAAVRLKAAYQMKAYREVYPDRYNARNVFEDILAHPATDADADAVLQQAWDEYRAAYDKLNATLEAECERYYFQLAATESAPHDDPFKMVVNTGLDDRKALNLGFLRKVRELLPATALLVFQERLQVEAQFIELSSREPRLKP